MGIFKRLFETEETRENRKVKDLEKSLAKFESGGMNEGLFRIKGRTRAEIEPYLDKKKYFIVGANRYHAATYDKQVRFGGKETILYDISVYEMVKPAIIDYDVMFELEKEEK